MNSRFFLVLILVLCLAGLAFAQSSTGTIQGTVADAQRSGHPECFRDRHQSGHQSRDCGHEQRGGPVQPAGFGPGSLQGGGSGNQLQGHNAAGHVANGSSREPGVQTATGLDQRNGRGDGRGSDCRHLDLGSRQYRHWPADRGPSAERPQFHRPGATVPGVTRGQPGNQQTGAGNQAETFRYAASGGGALSANGLRVQANNFLFDGIDNNESLVNTIVFFVDPDAIQEFRVDTNVAPAEYGRAGGAVVNATYKSGTNNWHGTVFWQHKE